jgi:hypothetical protein
MSGTDAELVELRKELLIVDGAEKALEDAAILAILDELEQSSIDALLNPDLGNDERTEWKLKTTAYAMRQVRSQLRAIADKRGYVEAQIESLTKGHP